VELTFAQRVGVVLAAAAAGFASWRFVERPFRSRTGPEARPRLFAGAAVVMIAAMLVGVHGIRSGGWPTRLGPELLAIASYRDSSNADARRCFSWPQHRLAPEQSCDYGDAVPSSVALWGDSHANAVISTLGEVAKAHHTSVRFFGQAGCPALLGVDITHPDFRDCRQHNDAVFTALTSRPDITTVVLISRYAYYAKGPPQGLGTTAAGEMVVMLTDTTGSARDSISREAVVQRQFRATVDALERAGKRVAIIYPIPELGYAVPGSLARLVRVGRDPAALASPATYYRARHAFEIAVMDAAGRDGSVLRIYPEKALCDATRCRAVDGGRPLYVDENHLSVVGARLLVPQFEHIFDLR
jgi:hypothetical protein